MKFKIICLISIIAICAIWIILLFPEQPVGVALFNGSMVEIKEPGKYRIVWDNSNNRAELIEVDDRGELDLIPKPYGTMFAKSNCLNLEKEEWEPVMTRIVYPSDNFAVGSFELLTKRRCLIVFGFERMFSQKDNDS